jgi:hypothetical protein
MPDGLAPALSKGGENFGWEFGWLARGKDRFEALFEFVGRGLAEHSDVVDLRQDETVTW